LLYGCDGLWDVNASSLVASVQPRHPSAFKLGWLLVTRTKKDETDQPKTVTIYRKLNKDREHDINVLTENRYNPVIQSHYDHSV